MLLHSEFNMKYGIAIIMTLILIGCSSNPKKDEVVSNTSISAQALNSSFVREGIKLEWECVWGTGLFDATCIRTGIKAIEATGYATSFGNSDALQEQAYKVAHDVALDTLNRFVKQEVTSVRVTNTMTKNIEKAQDKIKNKVNTAEVTITDVEAAAAAPIKEDTNFSARENNNEVVRTVTENIRTNAAGIVRGARVVSEKVVAHQRVAVTLRWDESSKNAMDFLRKNFVTN